MLAGWIGLGFSTSLMIGFRYDDRWGSSAAIRAMVLSTVSDVFLILGFASLFWLLVDGGVGAVALSQVEIELRELVHAAERDPEFTVVR